MSSVCRDKQCEAEIIWAVSPVTGKRMPVDKEPHDLGNVRLDYSGMLPAATVLAGAPLAAARQAGEVLHLNHFVTCPGRAAFKKTIESQLDRLDRKEARR